MNSWVSNLHGYIPTTLPFYKESVDSHDISSTIFKGDKLREDELFLLQLPKNINIDFKEDKGICDFGKLLVRESGKITLQIGDVEYEL